jgi:hypothetical protein
MLAGGTFAIIIEVRHQAEQLLACGFVFLGLLGKSRL